MSDDASRRLHRQLLARWRQLKGKYRAAGGLAVLFTYEALKLGIQWAMPNQPATLAAFVLAAGLGALYHLLAGVDLDDIQEATEEAVDEATEN